eukprot:6138977-Amphidinium_carterae.1
MVPHGGERAKTSFGPTSTGVATSTGPYWWNGHDIPSCSSLCKYFVMVRCCVATKTKLPADQGARVIESGGWSIIPLT